MTEEIKKTTIDNKNYPKLLKEIKNPPKALYYIGQLPKEKEICFAIVGTRRYSSYGKQATLEIAGNLAEAGLTIVSGLAPGIDTFCHQATLERKGKTIAILGTGLDEKSIYPKENIKLAKKIVEFGGCLISEYPPGTKGAQFTFPQRNRIVAGLSVGVLVVEAKIKSGALITAEYGIQQKKKIFAVPGSIYSSNSKGCHFLIKRGAKLVESAQDIINELDIKNLTTSKNLITKDKIVGENKEENLILEVLKEDALHIDKIIEKTKLSASIVASTLSILEIKGIVKNLGRNTFCLKSKS